MKFEFGKKNYGMIAMAVKDQNIFLISLFEEKEMVASHNFELEDPDGLYNHFGGMEIFQNEVHLRVDNYLPKTGDVIIKFHIPHQRGKVHKDKTIIVPTDIKLSDERSFF
ncbi:MAG: hypothetical protein WC682_02850 [Parcubacteria group bacterium]|jgi:hypothetical protein